MAWHTLHCVHHVACDALSGAYCTSWRNRALFCSTLCAHVRQEPGTCICKVGFFGPHTDTHTEEREHEREREGDVMQGACCWSTSDIGYQISDMGYRRRCFETHIFINIHVELFIYTFILWVPIKQQRTTHCSTTGCTSSSVCISTRIPSSRSKLLYVYIYANEVIFAVYHLFIIIMMCLIVMRPRISCMCIYM